MPAIKNKKTASVNHDIVTLPEMATYLRVCPRTVTSWVKAGKVKATKFGNHYRFTREERDRVAREGV